MLRSQFEKKLSVQSQHIDALEHVNNVVYVQWIQEIAGEHWLSHAPDAIKENVIWVVKKHIIDYKAPCHLGEMLTLKTETPKAYKGPLWDRLIWVFKSDGRLAVEATTTWCLLDKQSGRPMRITPEIWKVFIEEE